MKNKIRWLRVCYWLGAIIDALAAFRMLHPDGLFWGSDMPGFVVDAQYLFIVGPGVALMIGWTVLLLWADRKPLERKGVLLITVFPVIFGIGANNILGLNADFTDSRVLIQSLLLQAFLVGLLLYSYFNARDVEPKTEPLHTPA